MRFLPLTPRSFLVELADLEATLALFDALNANLPDGIDEIIPAARTLLVRTEPGVAADEALAAQIKARAPAPGTKPAERSVEIVELPVSYDGEDLRDVATFMGLSVAEVISAHQATVWQVAFCGFAPGFAYMTSDDPRFDVPRRPTPRTRLPAGSVALAGRFCGIYPKESPGGWQLIGRTDVPMWDLARDPAAILRPGVRCRFVERTASVHPVAQPAAAPTQITAPQPMIASAATGGLEVASTLFPMVFQDDGRMGHTGQGVSAAGALDRGAFHRANRALGNDPNMPALEVILGPVKLVAHEAMELAVTGAAQATVAGHSVPRGAAFAVDAGDEVLIDAPARGMRSYLAVRGGFDVETVFGSGATDTLAQIGPDPVTSGTTLGLAHAKAGATSETEAENELPKAGDVVPLAVTLGPRTDWFSAAEIRHFLEQDWLVTPASSRVGLKLEGEPLRREDSRELPSEGTEIGAVQIPHAGQPVLFLADHPLTGGYPVIATLRPEAIDLAGQIPPGARIRFVAAQGFAPITPEISE